jgi:uncharacterized membrane protein YfcA
MVAVTQLAIALAGLGVGGLFGLFGAGGSAFATPVLAVLGVPSLAAVASPLPAMVPAAMTGAQRHLRRGSLDRRIAALAVAGGVPGTVVGGLGSVAFDADRLVAFSGVLLLVVGARVLLPDGGRTVAQRAARRESSRFVVAASFGVGLLAGLLAIGGGFLLVPLFVLALGLGSREAAGTSMVVVACLTLPTVLTHWALGHVDWAVTASFTAGMLPGSLAGSAVAGRLPGDAARRAFGFVLVAFAAWFLLTR